MTARRVTSLVETRVERAAQEGDGSFAHAWRIYLESGQVLEPSTRRGYRSAMALVLRDPDKGGLPSEPTVFDVSTFHNKLVSRDGYAKNYANQVLRIMRRVAEVAAWTENPALVRLSNRVRQVNPHQEPELAVRCPPDDCLQRCLEVAGENLVERFVFIMCGRYSLRINEVMALLPSDYDFRSHTFVVQRSRRSATQRKNKQPLRVRLQERDWALVKQLMDPKIRAQYHGKRGPKTATAHRYLVPWSHEKLQRLMARVRQALGHEVDMYFPPGDAWHVLRHWGATQASNKRGSVIDVQIQLGDRSPTQAEKYVAHLRGTLTTSGIFESGGVDEGPDVP